MVLSQPRHPWIKHLDVKKEYSWLKWKGDNDNPPLRVGKGDAVIASPGGTCLLYRVAVGKGQIVYMGWQAAEALPNGRQPGTVEQEKDIDAASFLPETKPADAQVPAVDQQAAAEPTTKPLIDLASRPAVVTAQAEPAAEASSTPPVVPAPAPRETAATAVSEPAPAVNSFAAAPPPKKKGFLAGFFSQTPQAAPVMSTPAPEKPKPVIQLAATLGSEVPSTSLRASAAATASK